jgi:autotransporter-associated beta strand protein
VRVYCQTPAGQARLILTNGATAVDSAAGSGNIYVGYYTNSDSASTNMLVLSGRLATGSGGSVRMGANCALAEIDLLNNGVLEAGGVRVDTNNAPVFGESRLNFDGGTLRANASSTSFLGGLTNAFVLNGGATIDSSNYNITVTQPLLQAGSGGLTKVGSGVLTLDSVNTYTNTTLVSAGTLAGTGTIAGPLSVGANASLAPGDGGIGTLTVSGPLSLATGSTNYVKVNASTGTNDLVTGFTKVTYAGTLVVSNLAGTPVLNQSFHIFSAVAAPVGTITNIIPAPAAGLAWSFNPTNGMLTAVAGAQKNPTVFNSVTISNGNLTISGTNGVAGGQYVILSTTNLALPLVNWQPEVTNTFDVNGHFTYTLSLTNAGPQRFYTVRQ